MAELDAFDALKKDAQDLVQAKTAEQQHTGWDAITAIKEEIKKEFGGLGHNSAVDQIVAQQSGSDAVRDLKKEYEKYNPTIAEISNEEFTKYLIVKDKAFTGADFERDLKGRHDKVEAVQHERKDMRDGIAATDLMHLPFVSTPKFLGGGRYDNDELTKLDEDGHKTLAKHFDEMFQSEESKYTRGEVIKAIEGVRGQHQNGLKDLDPEHLHKEVWAKLLENKHAPERAAEHGLKAEGVDLSNDDQRMAIAHALAATADKHPTLGYYSADEIKNADPDTKKRIIDTFNSEFGGEIAKAGGRADKVLDAMKDVYHAPSGENNGGKQLNSGQYHAALQADLDIKATGIDLNDVDQRKAVAHALQVMYPDQAKSKGWDEEGLRTGSIGAQAEALKQFTSDFPDAKKSPADAKRVFDAIGAEYNSGHEAEDGKNRDKYRDAVNKLAAGQSPAPQADPAKADPKPFTEADLNDDQRASLILAEARMHPDAAKKMGLDDESLKKNPKADPKALALAIAKSPLVTAADKANAIKQFNEDFKGEIKEAGDGKLVLDAISKVDGKGLSPDAYHDKVHDQLVKDMAAKGQTPPGQTSPAPGTKPDPALVTDLPDVKTVDDDVKKMQLIHEQEAQQKNTHTAQFAAFHKADGQLGDKTKGDDAKSDVHFIKDGKLDRNAIRAEYDKRFKGKDPKEVEADLLKSGGAGVGGHAQAGHGAAKPPQSPAPHAVDPGCPVETPELILRQALTIDEKVRDQVFQAGGNLSLKIADAIEHKAPLDLAHLSSGDLQKAQKMLAAQAIVMEEAQLDPTKFSPEQIQAKLQGFRQQEEQKSAADLAKELKIPLTTPKVSAPGQGQEQHNRIA